MLLNRRLSVIWAAAIMLLTVLVCSGIALAITYGIDDGTRHPNVGALVDSNGAYCSGTLVPGTTDTTLNPSGGPVFLTAAHCAPYNDTNTVRVTFANPYIKGSSPKIRGTLHADPNEYQNGHDIAVVTFDQTDPDYLTLQQQIADGDITPAKLPAQGTLSN